MEGNSNMHSLGATNDRLPSKTCKHSTPQGGGQGGGGGGEGGGREGSKGGCMHSQLLTNDTGKQRSGLLAGV